MPYRRGLIGTYRRLYEEPPDETKGGARRWFHRTLNMVCVYMEGERGASFVRRGSPDEYFAWPLFHRVRVTADGETVDAPRGSVVVVPPGDSTVELVEEGHVWLGFSGLGSDLFDRCPNNDEYKDSPEGMAPIETWPEPIDGYRVRVYNLFQQPAGRPQCFVHRTAMANFGYGFPAVSGAKPDWQLTPHSHKDFEQLSIVHSGTHIYHMRRAWGRDSTEWLPDEHIPISSPGVAVAKPPDIHTIQLVSNGIPGGVLDFFCPIRADYASREGTITNRADYPTRAASTA